MTSGTPRPVLAFVAALLAVTLAAAGAHADDVPRGGNGTLPLGGGDGTLPLGAERANDGTLPLRLGGNEGTLPLRFEGQAQETAAAGRQVAATLALTAVTNAALPPPAQTLPCQLGGTTVSQHAASGTLALAADSFAVRGICYDHATQNIEVVAERGAARSQLVGRLPNPTPRSLSGRLTVQGAQGGRYVVDLTNRTP